MSVPPGAELTVLELISALKWKLRDIIPPPQSDTPLNEVLEYERRLRRRFKYLSLMEYNSSIPINVLPPEILTRIFAFVPSFHHHYHQFPPFVSAKASLRHRNSWISSTTHVCSHWRNIAIADPSLWNHVAGVHFAGRAGSLPLHVHQIVKKARGSKQGTLVSSSAVMDLLKWSPLGPQLASYHIRGSKYLQQEFWDLLDGIDAPNLESLALDMPLSEDHDDEEGHKIILPRVFSGHTPFLKRLSLVNIEFWPHNTFHNLTHLFLKYPWYEGRCRVPIAYFLDTIAASPTLEFLHLNSANFVVSDPSAYATRPLASLPSLRIFELGDFDSFLPRVLLSHIAIPETCFVYVWHHDGEDEVIYHDDFAFLPHHSRSAPATVEDLAAPLKAVSHAVVHNFDNVSPSITFCNRTIHFVREGVSSHPFPLNNLDDILSGVASLYVKETALVSWQFQSFIRRMPALDVVSFVAGKTWRGDFPDENDLSRIIKAVREWVATFEGTKTDDEVGELAGKSLTSITIPPVSIPEWDVEDVDLDGDEARALQLYRNGSLVFPRNGFPPCILSIDAGSNVSKYLKHPLPDYPGPRYIPAKY